MNAIFGLIRPFTLLAPAVGVASGVVVASAATGAAIESGALAYGIAAAILATVASNAWNQVYDVEIDRINKPDRPIPSGALSAAAAMWLGVAAALGAVLAAFLADPALRFLSYVLVGLGLTWVYSAPPLRMKESSWGALVAIAVARGLLVPVAGWALVASVRTVEPWFLGSVLGLFVLGAAATKDFADVEGDRAHGCETLPVVLGPRRAARVIAPFLVLPFLLYPVGAYAGWLQPPPLPLWILGGGLALVGTVTAAMLLRKPERVASGGGNHVTWALMYLMMLGAFVGTAVVYRAALS